MKDKQTHFSYISSWFAYSATLFFLTLVVCLIGDIPLAKVLRDPMQIVKAHPFTGFISNLGIILWCAGAVICWFSWFIIREHVNKKMQQQLLFWAAVLTTTLMLDDFFLFHEKIFPNVFSISDRVVIAAYAAGTLLFLWKFRTEVFQTPGYLLEVSLILFATSVLVDLIPPEIWKAPHLLEDGPKFFGIVGWTAFFIRYAFSAITDLSVRQV